MIDETLHNELMKSCDERIACIKQNIKSTHGKILFCLLANIEEPMEGNEIYLRWTEATLKIVHIEKMIYEAIYSQTKPLLPLLLKKFDECLAGGNMRNQRSLGKSRDHKRNPTFGIYQENYTTTRIYDVAVRVA